MADSAPRRTVPRWVGGPLIAANVLTAPLTALLGLCCLNSVNPMQLTFVATTEIENRTPQDLVVTPVGTIYSGTTRRWTLPTFSTTFPAIAAVRSHDLPVGSGSTLTVHYDWDDVQFSEVLVGDSGGVRGQVTIPPPPRHYTPGPARVVIEDLALLDAPDPRVVSAVADARERRGMTVLAWLMALPFLVHGGTFVWWLRRRRVAAAI